MAMNPFTVKGIVGRWVERSRKCVDTLKDTRELGALEKILRCQHGFCRLVSMRCGPNSRPKLRELAAVQSHWRRETGVVAVEVGESKSMRWTSPGLVGSGCLSHATMRRSFSSAGSSPVPSARGAWPQMI
jgi:hypothetical protein